MFGDIVGGAQDSDCISRLQQEQCLVLRGNHDQWAVERAEKTLDSEQLGWLADLPLRAHNEKMLAVHTDFELDGEAVRWRELSASLEVDDYFKRHSQWSWLLAAHSHRASMTRLSQGRSEYLSTAKLRSQLTMQLTGDRVFLDVGWVNDGVVVVDGLMSRVEFVFWGPEPS